MARAQRAVGDSGRAAGCRRARVSTPRRGPATARARAGAELQARGARWSQGGSSDLRRGGRERAAERGEEAEGLTGVRRVWGVGVEEETATMS